MMSQAVETANFDTLELIQHIESLLIVKGGKSQIRDVIFEHSVHVCARHKPILIILL